MSQTEISDEELVERDDGYTEEQYNYTQQREIQEADDVIQTNGGDGDDNDTRFERQISSEDDKLQQNEISNQNNVTEVRQELEKYDKTYPYKELIKKRPPTGVDVTCKEKYLSDEEFEQVFGITKEEFYSLPKWRQVNHKKKVELF